MAVRAQSNGVAAEAAHDHHGHGVGRQPQDAQGNSSPGSNMSTRLRTGKWSCDDVAWLMALYPDCGTQITAFALARAPRAVKSAAKNHALRRDADARWQPTPEEAAWIAALYPDLTAKEVAAAIFGEDGPRSVARLYAYAARHRITKSDQFWLDDRACRIRRGQTIGREFWFKKGHAPPNKGRKGYHAPGCEKGWFPKGHQRSDTAPLYAERIDTEGYVLIKVSRAEQGRYALPWQPKHRILWERTHGKVPKGYILVCQDGNKQNCDPANWRLTSRSEHMRNHTIHNWPSEIKQVINLAGALKRRINNVSQKALHT